MTAPRGLLAAFLVALLVVTAVVLQTVVVARLDLPYGHPDLVLVVVVALALTGGPTVGMGAGFSAGLLDDLLSDHPAGILALVFLLVGYACGHLAESSDESLALPLTVVGMSAIAAMVGYAVLLGILGSARLDWGSLARTMPISALYDVVLAPFLVPVVAVLDRRLTGETR